MERSALIVGAGSGVSASFARVLASNGYRVALASRQAAARTPELPDALRMACDASDPDARRAALRASRRRAAAARLSCFTTRASEVVDRWSISIAEDVQRSLQVTAFGAFLVAQQAARRMLAQGAGMLLFTGASASVKGYAQSAPFAMGKFALRGLVQSIARELAPQNIHVAHVVIDGAVRGSGYPEADARQPARPGCDRADHVAAGAAAAHRVELGNRSAAVGGEVLVSRPIDFEAMQPIRTAPAYNNGEIVVRRETARSRVGNPASTATKHGGDSRHCCFGINGPGH